MFGSVSMTLSSYTDCALSGTGPYESTAMVTGPIPRNPNATRPNANTAGAIIRVSSPYKLMKYDVPIRMTTTTPIQNALKLPAVSPDRMLSDAPPSRDDMTTSLTCADSVEV